MEGEYLILVNDLRDQYNEMKEKYNKEVAFLKEENAYLKEELNKLPTLKYKNEMFSSTRPSARRPIYVNYI